MHIWILNHHAVTPEMNGITRHYDFAKELVKRGHQVTIAASSFHYSEYKELKNYDNADYLMEYIDGICFVWLKTQPYHGNGIGRVLNMLSYAKKAKSILTKIELPKPDIIVGSSLHLFAVWAASKLAKKYNTPFIMEVRDLWPQTLIDMGMSKFHPFVLLLGWLERHLYKRADKIISNLPYADEYIGKFVSKDKLAWISNGVDLSRLKYIPRKEGETFLITYTGAIGYANNLQTLLNAALALQDRKDIFFKVIGEGAEKQKLKQFVLDNNLVNVSIEDAVPKSEVTKVLQDSDVLYFNLIDSPVFKYGISSNKLFDYLASGRVIIFSTNARNNPVQSANAGYSIEPDNVDVLKNTILKICSLPHQERVHIGQNGRRYAEEHYSIEGLVNKLEHLLLQEAKRHGA